VVTLQANREQQLKERRTPREAWQDHGLIFTRQDGTLLRSAGPRGRLPNLTLQANPATS